MTYVDVILPVPLEGMFTYAVPEGTTVQVGMRVVVPFGRSKTYVGLVARIHQTRPEGYEVKAILQVMDAAPIVTEQQLKLWQWISDYYLSPIGDDQNERLMQRMMNLPTEKPRYRLKVSFAAAIAAAACILLLLILHNPQTEPPRLLTHHAIFAEEEMRYWQEMETMTTPERLAAHQQEIMEKGEQLAAYIQQRQIQPIIEEYNEY